MTKKIFRTIFLITAAVLILCLIVISGVLYDYFTSLQKSMLSAQLTLAAQGVENEGLDYFEDLELNGLRLTLIDISGNVLYDSSADISHMENHLEREEVKQAFNTGYGESIRHSSTLGQNTIYQAIRLDNGNVLRISASQYSIISLLLESIKPIIYLMLAILIFSGLFARTAAKKIVDPLNNINLDEPLENDVYEEISPLLGRIHHQQQRIAKQMEELKIKQDEFSAVTKNMSEGLLLLNSKGIIISINDAALKYFSADISCIGEDILTINRSLAIQKLISKAEKGEFSETVIEQDGFVYQINAEPIFHDGKFNGICILIMDISLKAHNENMRREFSANVSHELKTPLHSIMASAEIIENGIAKEEDKQKFIGNIRKEAERLVVLIDDIIRLSELDEGRDIEKHEVVLKNIAEDAIEALAQEARLKNVSITLNACDASINASYRLIYEIIYNLCDNAVKYNKDNGKVEVEITENEKEVVLKVTDDGIGIPKEAQERVFERFYRVDKSHSRETGGTGLGLSIVKHAAKYHNAKIELDSKPNEGTTISVIFPK